MYFSSVQGSFVVMGVAGCGKSSLGASCAAALDMTLVEGDSFHSQASLLKMRGGVPLSDGDRTEWLNVLANRLREAVQAGSGVVMACSALRRAYREQLRLASPDLRFVFLELSEDDAHARVASRQGHVFPASLVASQFLALESPRGEPGVLTLDAMRSPQELCEEACRWLTAGAGI